MGSFDPRQASLVPKADPTGNGQPSVEIVVQRDSGPVGTGIYLVQHGGQQLKIVHANPAPSADAAILFELDRAGKIVVQET